MRHCSQCRFPLEGHLRLQGEAKRGCLQLEMAPWKESTLFCLQLEVNLQREAMSRCPQAEVEGPVEWVLASWMGSCSGRLAACPCLQT